MAELRLESTGTIKLFESDSTSSITIASPASLSSNRTITLPDGDVTLVAGTMSTGGGVNTPAFEASLSANGSGTDDTLLNISCNTELFDVGGCYNNTSGTVTLNSISVPAFGWAPNEACKVIVYATAQGECGGGALGEGNLVIKKDGTVIKNCRMVDDDGQARNSQTTYALVSMDGSSNYLQAFYKINETTGGGWTLETGSPAGSGTTFGGFKIIE